MRKSGRAKPCFTNAFLVFRHPPKTHMGPPLMKMKDEDLMKPSSMKAACRLPFLHRVRRGGHKRASCHSKVFIFDRFYKVFRHVGNAMPEPSLGNAFLMILEPLFRKLPGNDQFEQGFIRVFATRFCILENNVFHWFYKVSRCFGNALRKPPLGNAFLMILEPIFDCWLQKSQSSTGPIRVFATRFWILKICEFQWRY